MMRTAASRAPDVRDMAIVHRVFRREFTLAPRILRDIGPAEHARQDAVQQWFRTVLHGVHHHHTSEDALIFPLLAARIPSALIATMAEQHAAVEKVTDDVEAGLAEWVADVPGARAALADTYERGMPVLVRHLDDEERDIVPLIAQHMTAEEYGRMATSGNGVIERRTLLMSFGAMIEECSPDDADFMISHLPEEYQRDWRDHARDAYAALMALVRGDVDREGVHA